MTLNPSISLLIESFCKHTYLTSHYRLPWGQGQTTNVVIPWLPGNKKKIEGDGFRGLSHWNNGPILQVESYRSGDCRKRVLPVRTKRYFSSLSTSLASPAMVGLTNGRSFGIYCTIRALGKPGLLTGRNVILLCLYPASLSAGLCAVVRERAWVGLSFHEILFAALLFFHL